MKHQPTIYPPSLKPGDRIKIVCPSRFVTLEEILPAAEWIRQHGFRVEYGETIGKTDGQFAGSDDERIEDFQKALNDEGIRAIWCARGGYGAARIIDKINFSSLRNNPKWIIGFSDVTAIHMAIFKHNVVSLHAPMAFSFKNNHETAISFGLMLSFLTGKRIPLEWKATPFDTPGTASGKLLGGNLSVIYSLRGTPFDIPFENTLLMIEDIDEYLYHIDRMCNNLRLGNKCNPKALMVGSFTNMHDNSVPFGKNANEIIKHYFQSPPAIPVTHNAPFGHTDYNLPLLIGAEATLNIGSKRTTLLYHGNT